MAVISEDEIHRRCTIAAIAATALHLVAIAGGAYQIAARHPGAEHAFIYLGQFLWYWGPAVLLLLMRKFCVLVGIVAVPVVILFALRLHHVMVFWFTGVNSMAVQKGDGLGWVEMLFSLAAGAVALAWLAILLIWRLIDVLRGWRKG
jgi:hypothetical protein